MTHTGSNRMNLATVMFWPNKILIRHDDEHRGAAADEALGKLAAEAYKKF